MAITDTQYYRVLGLNHWKDSLHRPADWIIGQDDFESNGMNRYQLQPQSNSLNWCYDAHFFESGLLVADTGNSRILWYPELPDRHGMEATSVIGPANFTTGSENEGTRFGTENALYWPFSVSLAGNRLALADTGNHRIVFYDLNQQQLYD